MAQQNRKQPSIPLASSAKCQPKHGGTTRNSGAFFQMTPSTSSSPFVETPSEPGVPQRNYGTPFTMTPPPTPSPCAAQNSQQYTQKLSAPQSAANKSIFSDEKGIPFTVNDAGDKVYFNNTIDLINQTGRVALAKPRSSFRNNRVPSKEKDSQKPYVFSILPKLPAKATHTEGSIGTNNSQPWATSPGLGAAENGLCSGQSRGGSSSVQLPNDEMEIDDLPANDNIETGNGLSEPTAPSESLKDAMESNAALYDEAFRSVPQSLAEDDDDLSKENKPSESACSTESPAVEMEVDSEPEQPTPMDVDAPVFRPNPPPWHYPYQFIRPKGKRWPWDREESKAYPDAWVKCQRQCRHAQHRRITTDDLEWMEGFNDRLWNEPASSFGARTDSEISQLWEVRWFFHKAVLSENNGEKMTLSDDEWRYVLSLKEREKRLGARRVLKFTRYGTAAQRASYGRPSPGQAKRKFTHLRRIERKLKSVI